MAFIEAQKNNADVSLVDLVTFTEATAKLGLSHSDLIKEALAGKVRLFHPSKHSGTVAFKLAQLENEGQSDQFWAPLFDYDNNQDSILATLSFETGQPFALDTTCVASLLLNGSYEQLGLLKAQLDAEKAIKSTARSNYLGGDLRWITEDRIDQQYSIDDTFLLERELEATLAKPNATRATPKDTPSNSALKVIGLLMHHLAKSPKYASGASPNKSQIKELLLDLALELGVDPYGLNKADERVLSEAMKYLENQKL